MQWLTAELQDCGVGERCASLRTTFLSKDEFGGRDVRVHGHAKVLRYLMFGMLALTVGQLM